jgi:hypothetical protein
MNQKRSLGILIATLTLTLFQVGCVCLQRESTLEAYLPVMTFNTLSKREQAEADYLIKRGNQLIGIGERMQKKAEKNLINGQELINKGNEMKAQGGD